MTKILSVDFCLDGGTSVIETDDGTYYVDIRLETTTECSVFPSYPENDSVVVEDQMAYELIALLSRYIPKQGEERSIRILLDGLHERYQILT